MAFDQSRDMRSNAHETKRVKDHNHKWARGMRAAPGVRSESPDFGVSEEPQEKGRPWPAPNGKHYRFPNVTKVHMSYQRYKPLEVPWKQKSAPLVELRDPANMSSSLRDLLPTAPAPFQTQRSSKQENSDDDFLYSFDKTESPGKPLPLDVFVKTNTRATEKLVEKEYDILDYNGDSVKGRKALKDVHRGRAAASAPEEPALVEDEGFELV
ncbi:hypothetical protein F4808DRAFT_267865 [Astrocystis sublimbata]|nr:hypothetical protein F4808DRAFT_267865 [Astrocystis sublimbata]